MTTPDSNSSTHYDEIHHAKHHHDHNAEQIENMERLKPTPSQFEKLYLAPETPVAGNLRWTFANPTPIALAGFLLANTPTSIQLMGWGGAGGDTGNTSAGIGTFYFLAAILLYAGGVGEWILGNTFPAVVFFTFGGFWGTFGATLTPFFNAINGYGTTAADTATFYRSFAVFLIWMCILCIFYMIAALRTNVCLVAVLFCFVVTFPLLAASYYAGANGSMDLSNTCRIAGGAFSFVASLVAWYLWFSMILESVDFPFALPVGDLSKLIKGRSEIQKAKSERDMA